VLPGQHLWDSSAFKRVTLSCRRYTSGAKSDPPFEAEEVPRRFH